MQRTAQQNGLLYTIISNLRMFYEGSRLSYIALFHWLRPTTYLASKIIMPMNQILFFAFLGEFSGQNSRDFYVIGNAVQMAAVSGIYGVTMSIGGDRWAGTLPYLFGAPSSRLIMFLGRAFFHVLDGAVGVIFGLVLGVLLLGLDLSQADPLLLLLAIMAATISTSGLGLFLGSISLVTVNVWFFNNTLYFLLLLFSGANIARGDMPAWMVAVGDILPLTRSIEAARRVAAGGSFDDISGLLTTEVFLGLFYASFGFVFFRWIEFQARRRGTIDRM
jgi:ABC-2 type transport system permease protein